MFQEYTEQMGKNVYCPCKFFTLSILAPKKKTYQLFSHNSINFGGRLRERCLVSRGQGLGSCSPRTIFARMVRSSAANCLTPFLLFNLSLHLSLLLKSPTCAFLGSGNHILDRICLFLFIHFSFFLHNIVLSRTLPYTYRSSQPRY